MMLLVLRIVTGVAILLGVVIAAGLAYSHYERKLGRAESHERTVTIPRGAGERVGETLNLIASVGVRQGVMLGYGEMRSILIPKDSFEQRKEWTERETIERLGAIPSLKPVIDELHRIYKTYERARFGSEGIPKEEVDLFLSDLRAVYGNMLRKGEIG